MATTDINKVILVGRMTRNAEISYTLGGMAILQGSLAVNWHYKDSDEVSYFDFKLFGKFAEVMQPHLTTGQQIALDGTLKQERWTDKETNKGRSKVVIIADSLQLLGGRKDDSYQQNNGYDDGFQQNGYDAGNAYGYN